MPEVYCPLRPSSVAVHCRSSNAHRPKAVWQCIVRVALPNNRKQCGSALHEFHCPLPPGSEVVPCKCSTAHYPHTVWQNCPQAVRHSTARCPQPRWQCIAGVPMPNATRQRGSALQELHWPLTQGNEEMHWRNFTTLSPSTEAVHSKSDHCPLTPGSEGVHCRSCNAQCPQALWRCIAGVLLPTAPKECGIALHEFHCPLPSSSVAVNCTSSTPHYPEALRELHCPPLLGSEGVHCRSCTSHCPQAVWQCIAGFPRPLPLGNKALPCTGSSANYPHRVWQRMVGYALPIAPGQCAGAL